MVQVFFTWTYAQISYIVAQVEKTCAIEVVKQQYEYMLRGYKKTTSRLSHPGTCCCKSAHTLSLFD